MAEFPVAIITDEFTQDFEYICETAVRMSIPALEIRTAWNKNIVDMSDSEIGKMAKVAGLEIVSIASPVYKCTLPDGGDIDHRFEQDAFQAAHTYDGPAAYSEPRHRNCRKAGSKNHPRV